MSGRAFGGTGERFPGAEGVAGPGRPPLLPGSFSSPPSRSPGSAPAPARSSRGGGGARSGAGAGAARGGEAAGAALLRKQPREGILGAGSAPSRARGAGPRAARVTGRPRPAAAERLPRVGGRLQRRGRAGRSRLRESVPSAAATPAPGLGAPARSGRELGAGVAELDASSDLGAGART